MSNKIEIYLDIIAKSFKSVSVYNSNIVMNLIGGFITVFVQVALWIALYKGNLHESTSLMDAITYTLINTLIIKKCLICISGELSTSIYNGNIEIDIIRPITIKRILTMKIIGRNIFSLCSFSLPIIVVTIFLWGIQKPFDCIALMYSMITAILGQIIFWLYESILGYTAFWLKANWYLFYIELAVLGVFGGTVIPMWFYPSWLQTICKWLPFKYIGYESIDIYLHGCEQYVFIEIILMQVGWIVILFICEKIIWSRAIKKIEICGG